MYQNLNSTFQPVQQVPIESAMYAFIRKVVKWEEVNQFFQDGFTSLAEALETKGVTATSSPCIFIHRVDEINGTSELSVAFQINNPISIPGGGTLLFPVGQALLMSNFGHPDTINSIHSILQNYVTDNNLSVGVVIEEHRYNPQTQPDQETWETLVTYRLYNGIDVPRILC